MTKERIVELAINEGLRNAMGDPKKVDTKEMVELLGRAVITFLLDIGLFAGLQGEGRKELVRLFGEAIINAEIEINEDISS